MREHSASHVAVLLNAPPGPQSGGPGTFAAGLIEALARRGRFSVTLLAPSQDSGKAGQRVSQLALAWSQMRQLWQARPDVVHVHEHPSLLMAAVIYRAARGGKPGLVFSSHFDPVDRRSLWKRAVMGALFAQCDRMTVMAEQSVEKLALVATPMPDRSKVHVVPAAACVRLRRRGDAEVVRFGAEMGCDGRPMVLQISNFVYPAKVAGTLRLIEAFAEVRRRFSNARLLLLGRGPLLPTVIEARDRAGLNESVIVPGAFIEDLSLPMTLCDVQCHISFQDMCPIGVLEGMHAGKPIVAARAGGIPELIEDRVSGRLVDGSPQQIAEAILDLLEHPSRAAALGARAQHIAQTRFTWNRVAADCERLYEAAALRVGSGTSRQAIDVVH